MSRKQKEDREPSGVPPVPVSKENLEEVVRVIKVGLHHHHEVSDETREALGMWATEMEDEIDVEEGRDPDERKGLPVGAADFDDSEQVLVEDFPISQPEGAFTYPPLEEANP